MITINIASLFSGSRFILYLHCFIASLKRFSFCCTTLIYAQISRFWESYFDFISWSLGPCLWKFLKAHLGKDLLILYASGNVFLFPAHLKGLFVRIAAWCSVPLKTLFWTLPSSVQCFGEIWASLTWGAFENNLFSTCIPIEFFFILQT